MPQYVLTLALCVLGAVLLSIGVNKIAPAGWVWIAAGLGAWGVAYVYVHLFLPRRRL